MTPPRAAEELRESSRLGRGPVGDPAGAVCQSCGLCCDGTLFDVVCLAPNERPPRGLPLVIRRDGSPAFPERCGALDGCTCSVYAERPAACRGFECLLSIAVHEDSVDLDSALETVERAKSLIAAVEETLGPAAPGDRAATMQRARDYAGGVPTTDELECAEAFLETYFLGRRHPDASEQPEGSPGGRASSDLRAR